MKKFFLTILKWLGYNKRTAQREMSYDYYYPYTLDSTCDDLCNSMKF